MGGLVLKLLGTPEISHHDRALKFATRKVLALLAYLAVEDGAQPRDRLVALLWPASDEQLGKSALRNTLARLRGTLSAIDDPLLIDRDHISFNRQADYTLDLNLITQAMTDLQSGSTSATPTPVVLQAARSARGPFLDGFSLSDAPDFDDWLVMQRAVWQHRLELVFDRLSLHQLDTRQLPAAIATVARWVSHDRLNEGAYRRLMRLHFLNGDQAAALQTYDICRTLLHSELGVAPAPRTEELLAQIRSIPAPVQIRPIQAEARTSLNIPFVGRSTEYQRLAQCFQTVQTRQLQVAVVSGESGIGKTRLSEEFLKWATTEGAAVLRGRAFETSGRLPYQPIIDALRERLERENAPDDLLDDVWLAELTRILPELRERYPDLPQAAGDDSTARTRLFEAVARLGEAFSAQQPVIWLMDDLQWADVETLELLHYLGRTWRGSQTPIMLLMLMRSGALGPGSSLREWMSALTRDIPITRITLSAINTEDVQHLIRSLAGNTAPGSSELAAWFTAETAGQPFFLTETLTTLDAQEALVWRGEPSTRTLDPPATLAKLKALGPQSLVPAIRDVVLSRLEWLGPPAAAVLAAAAVIGRNCRFERLCQVSGTDELAGLNALDELLYARLIVEDKDQIQPYTISHDRIREVVYARLSAARRRVFHRRALTALAEARAPSAELAYHALAAEDWQAAFDHSLLAGHEAMRLYAVAEGLYHYQTARRLLTEQHLPANNATCQRLYLELGKAFEIEFQQLRALAVYEELQALAAARGVRALELAALVASCDVRSMPFDAHDVDQATSLAEQALPLAHALGDLMAEAQIEHNLALLQLGSDGQINRAIPHIENSARLARQAGAVEPLGMALLDLATLSLSLGHSEQAEAACQEAVDLFRRQENRPRLQDAIHLLGMLRLGTGEFDRALALLDEAYAANEALGNPTEALALATTRSTIHIIRGDYARALTEFSLLRDVDEGRVAAPILICVRQQLAWLYFEVGAYDAAHDQCRRALAYQDEGQPARHAPTLTILTLVNAARQQWNEAAQAAARGIELFDRAGKLYPEWWEALPFPLAQGELALVQGDIAQAENCAVYLEEEFGRLRLRHLLSSVWFFRARIALAKEDKLTAYRDLQAAVAVSDELGSRRELREICWTLEQLEADLGNRTAPAYWHDRACAEIAFTLEHIDAPELRATFLAKADVQAILGVRQLTR